MKIILNISESEQIKFLRSRGFTIKPITVNMGYPCYHNDIEHEGVVVNAVFLNEQEFNRPGGYNFDKTEWVENAFNEEASTRFKELLMGK